MIKLSISVPTLQNRHQHCHKLISELERQTNGLPCEVLWLGDLKTMTIGMKRNHLMSISSGKYVCTVDDDDWVSEDYVSLILQKVEEDKEVILFPVSYYVDGVFQETLNYQTFRSMSQLARQGLVPAGSHSIVKPAGRHPIKKLIAEQVKYSDSNFGEDNDYGKEIESRLISHSHIDKAIYHYYFNKEQSETWKYNPNPPNANESNA